MPTIQQLKERFGVIGRSEELDRAIEVAQSVASTDLSVLVTGESGVGKEFIPQIIHFCSPRKHNVYIAVNCGAIPEGTIDSELFGHEKGAFTGATESRKGYFEEADGGTLFLDEVAELPLSTQVRLLRVLQTGEFIRVGSSKVQKTNVRVIAATNINLRKAISSGKFREDLFYRLNTVPVIIPPLRERKGDIHPLFQKFALDFADKYTVPAIRLSEDAVHLLTSYRWPGNIRQLKSVTEQISVLEKDRHIDAHTLAKYLPADNSDHLPAVVGEHSADYLSDRDIIFKILFQLRKEVDDLKQKLDIKNDKQQDGEFENSLIIESNDITSGGENTSYAEPAEPEYAETETQNLSIHKTSIDLYRKALEKHGGRRKPAAEELGISERTLFRKIKEYGLE